MSDAGHPDHVCDAIGYILMNEFITGQVLFVDGGEGMNSVGRNTQTSTRGHPSNLRGNASSANCFWTGLQNMHPRLGNSALARPLNSVEHAEMVSAATAKIAELLSVLQVDHRSDHNTRETPKRVARMLVNEVMKGRFVSPPKLTEFANTTSSRELIVMGPIEVRSTCAHHLMPIYGKAYIGVLSSESRGVIGLSKYDRVVEHFSLRLQIQEELTHQIGRYLMEQTCPAGLAVRIGAVRMSKRTEASERRTQSDGHF